MSRILEQIVTSNLTPPHSNYFVLIYAINPRERSKPTSSTTTQRPTREAFYPIQIEVSDFAFMQAGDENAYDTMHNDFRLLCDRMADLIEAQNWIGDSPKTTLLRAPGPEDRLIEKFNLSSEGYEIESELTAEALKMGLKIKEVPITCMPREYGSSYIKLLRDARIIFGRMVRERIGVN